LSECTPWVDKQLTIDFSKVTKKPIVVYESPPMFIRKNMSIKLTVKHIRGYWECNSLSCTLQGELVVRVIRKTTGEAYEYSIPFTFTSTPGLPGEAQGGKDIEIKPVSEGKYYIEVIIPVLEKRYNAWLTTLIKAQICRQ